MTVYRRPDPIPRRDHAQEGAGLVAVRRETANLSQLIARQLFAAITQGRLAEGSILPNEQALAAELGVSRTALREAITGLASKGVVEARRRRGTQVLDRSHWNFLDQEIISWLRESRGQGVSAELWRAAALALPNLAGTAASFETAGRLKALAGAIAAAGDGEARLPARIHFLTELAALARNRFLLSLVTTALRNLAKDDPGFLRGRSGGLTAEAALRIAEAVAAGSAAAATQLTQAALEAQPAEAVGG